MIIDTSKSGHRLRSHTKGVLAFLIAILEFSLFRMSVFLCSHLSPNMNTTSHLFDDYSIYSMFYACIFSQGFFNTRDMIYIHTFIGGMKKKIGQTHFKIELIILDSTCCPWEEE